MVGRTGPRPAGTTAGFRDLKQAVAREAKIRILALWHEVAIRRRESKLLCLSTVHVPKARLPSWDHCGPAVCRSRVPRPRPGPWSRDICRWPRCDHAARIFRMVSGRQVLNPGLQGDTALVAGRRSASLSVTAPADSRSECRSSLPAGARTSSSGWRRSSNERCPGATDDRRPPIFVGQGRD